MKKHIIDENTGISYTLHGDYYLPDLELPAGEENIQLGRWGNMHLKYLKNHKRILYTNLLSSGRLMQHCKEIENSAIDRLEFIIKQMKQAENITEQLKATDQMAWVGAMNNIKSRAEEIIKEELIFS